MRQRSVQDVTVTKAESGSFTVDSGWTFGNRHGIKVGDRLRVETIGFSRVVGIEDLDTGQVYYRYSDEDLDAQDREQQAKIEERKRAALEANREEWTRIEAGLPDWVRVRIEHFHGQGGAYFEMSGWGYELAIAELAVMYAHPDAHPDNPEDEILQFVDTPEITEFAQKEGTSGNQHGMAKALARMHLDGQSLAGTVSALSPITGEPFYVPKER